MPDPLPSLPPGHASLGRKQAGRCGSDRFSPQEDMGLLFFSVVLFPLLFSETEMAVRSIALPEAGG